MARILVIDDDELVVQTIRTILEGAGHEVQEAADLSVGIDDLAADADLVITDLIMPDQDGIEVIKAIAKRPGAPPILAISGGGAAGGGLYLRAAVALGATDTLPKPFTPTGLRGKVEMLLKQRARRS